MIISDKLVNTIYNILYNRLESPQDLCELLLRLSIKLYMEECNDEDVNNYLELYCRTFKEEVKNEIR